MRKLKLEELAEHSIELFDQLSHAHNRQISTLRGKLTRQEGVIVSYVAARVLLSQVSEPALTSLQKHQAREAVEMVIRLLQDHLNAPVTPLTRLVLP